MKKIRRKKTKHIDQDLAEQEKERETGDIYDDKQREEILDEDGITAAENAFMQVREMKHKKIIKAKKTLHKDTVSVELAENDYKED